jgi:hypothetical protein
LGAKFPNLDFDILLEIVYNSIIPENTYKGATTMETLDALKEIAIELVTVCADVDLLDFVCKLLTSEML